MKVTLIDGPADGREIAWPSLGYTPAPHAFVTLKASPRDPRDASAVYTLDPSAGARSSRTATFVGIRRRR